MALWLLGPDPGGNCCGCEGKSGPCDNCSSPGCAINCSGTLTQGCPLDGDCNPIVYPVYGAPCMTVNAFIPCICEAPPTLNVATVIVGLNLTGMSVGSNYDASVYWQYQGDPTISGSYTWSFTATATDDATSFVSVPNPSATNEPGWTPFYCKIV